MRSFVRKRGERWTAYYFRSSGRGQRQYSKGGFRTKADALAYVRTVVAEIEKNTLVEPSRLTLGEYLVDHWLPLMRHSLRPGTWDSYQRMMKIHVVPRLGATVLQKLTVDQLDRLYVDLLANGHKFKDGGLSPKTVRYIHNTLHKALKDAERKGLVQRNVATAADPPKSRQHGSTEMKTWTAPQVRTFLAGMASHRLYAAFVLLSTTGMRRGEVLGLRWIDVDLEARQLSVRQTVLTVDYKITYGTPKTARGRRTLALDVATADALADHRERQIEERAILGAAFEDHGLVFTHHEGRPVHPDYFSQLFERSISRLVLPRIRLHDLRHTCATLSLAAGVPPKVISTRLGHATVAFTQDVYVHAMPDLETEAAEHMGAVILGGPPAIPRPPALIMLEVDAEDDRKDLVRLTDRSSFETIRSRDSWRDTTAAG